MTHFVVGSLVVAVEWLLLFIVGSGSCCVVVVVGSRGPMFLVDPVLLPGAPIRLHKKGRLLVRERRGAEKGGKEAAAEVVVCLCEFVCASRVRWGGRSSL